MNKQEPIAVSFVDFVARAKLQPTSTFMQQVAKAREYVVKAGEVVDDELIIRTVEDQGLQESVFCSSMVTLNNTVNHYSLTCILLRLEEVEGKWTADLAFPTYTPNILLLYSNVEVAKLAPPDDEDQRIYLAPADKAEDCDARIKEYYAKRAADELKKARERGEMKPELVVAPIAMVPSDSNVH